MATSAELTREWDKELLLSRVNELVFVDALAGFECRRCERTLIRHYVAHCGHYFCANCKRVLLQSKSNCPLPACKQPLMDMDVQNVEFERKLFDLKAHCPNKRYGCPFVSQLKDLGGHLRVCKDTREAALPVEIQGPSALETILRELSIKFDKLSADVNKIKEETRRSLQAIENKVDNNTEDINKKMAEMIKTLDKKTSENIKSLLVFKEEVDNHNKDMERKMAEMKKTFDGKSSETVNNLKDIKVEMEKKIKSVETKVENNNVTDTKTEVENLKINLKTMTQKVELVKQEVVYESKRYTDGKVKEIISPLSKKLDEKMSECNEKITTMEKTTRDNQLVYNSKIEQKVLHLQSLVIWKNPQINCFTLAENKCNFQPDFTWKISGIKERLKQTTFELKSEAFTWNGYPVRAQAKIEVKQDGVVWVSLCLQEINEGKDFHLKLIPNVYYVLRDRSGNRDTKHRSTSFSYLFRSPFQPSLTFERQLVHKSWLTDPLYNVDDCVVVEVYVEPPSVAQLVHSYDGTLVWAIDNYHKRKEMAKEYLVWYHESPYFYTAPNGYRVQVWMCLDGCGEYRGKGLTADILFLTGEFDTDLTLTFPHQTTVTLFNRKDPQRNITKTVDQDIQTNKEYFVDVCSHEEIEDVIENDTVFFKVTIKPKN